MIDYTLEFVNKTTSNSLFMFLFCNVIIILILLGNSKPGSEDGSKESMLISESVLSSKSMLLSESTTLNSKTDLKKPVLISESVLSSKPVFVSESVLSSRPGPEKSELIAESTLPLNTGLQEPGMISKSVLLSSQPAGSDQSLTSKSGLNVTSSGLKLGSDCSEKDERGKMRKTESLEVENESLEVECMLRRRVEEFIRKVNTQWKLENTYLLY
ncbi:hypothetical protein Bca52824_004164 [Brassica carinata]|uniref:Uncharacterized protein n=1 Tax=Brassica carinata TaxID=52824 RepID=A0A8X7WL39_BRACI|nr:hypothetical protein Bca52824_004164 [Brassica carinata]